MVKNLQDCYTKANEQLELLSKQAQDDTEMHERTLSQIKETIAKIKDIEAKN